MKNNSEGYSLIELMIAMAMGMFLLAGISTMLTQTKVLYEKNQFNTDVQESGRFAIEHLSKALQLGHFLGGIQDLDQITFGNGLPPVAGNCNGGADFYNNANDSVLFGVVPDGAILFGGCIDDRVSDNGFPSDVLVIKNASSMKITDQNNDNLLGEDDGIQPDAIYLTTFASQGVLEVGEQIIGNAIAANADVNIWPFNLGIYYLGQDENGDKALKRYTLTQAGMSDQVIAENIDGLRILYGVDEIGDFSSVRYYSGDQIAQNDWINVVSAKIYVVAFSDTDPKYSSSSSYQIGDLAVAELDDGRRRAVLQTTVSIRNAVLRKVTQNGNVAGN